jgi:ABC-type cobalamin/Fe3+-siderophores transport system ATPase subunit
MNSLPILELKDWQVNRWDCISIGPHDFRLSAGEIVVIMGPSGVGKTTWLLTLLGYEELDLQIGGERWQSGKQLKPGSVPTKALYIPQNLPFNPNWEVQEYLGRLPWGNRNPFNLLPISMQPVRLKRVHEVLDRIGLLHRAKATVAELSGGESQRAAIAQIILLSPQLLVADEFISALDPGMSLWILDECRQQIFQTGGAAIIALHDVQTAVKVADRILLFWAPTISHQPWELSDRSIVTNQSIIYTLLCLARWSKDLPFRTAIRHLIDYLQIWITNLHSWKDLQIKYPENSILIIDDLGNFNSIDSSLVKLHPPSSNSKGDLQLDPIKIEINGSTKIGIAASFNQHIQLTVLA